MDYKEDVSVPSDRVSQESAHQDAEWIVGITDHITPPADIEQSAFPEARFHFLPDWRAAEENREAWQQVDAILVWHWRVDQATVGLLDRCKIAVRYGVGYDLVDVDAIVKRGIPFCNTPDYGARSWPTIVTAGATSRAGRSTFFIPPGRRRSARWG